MRRLTTSIFIALLLPLSLTFAQDADELKRPLTKSEQEALLAKRLPADPLQFGNFDSFASFYHMLKLMNMCTDNYELIKNIKLFNPFPPDYTPSTREIFDIIARTTGTSWRYDEKTVCWVFNPPPMPLPYKISLAKGWRAENRGFYIFHAPRSAPVGMDIYLLGHYTPEQGAKEDVFFDKIRDFWALRLAEPIVEKSKLKLAFEDMEQRTVGGAKALYWQCETTEGRVWRQWVFIAKGNLFAIVSTIDKDKESELLPDVLAMIESFQALP